MEQTITTWFIKPSTNYDHLNHLHWEDLLTYILVDTDATGTQHCLRPTATLPCSLSAWSQPPQSAQQQQRLLLPTLVQVGGLDNCTGIHNSPQKSKSVQHGHLPSLLHKLACKRTCMHTHVGAHAHAGTCASTKTWGTACIAQYPFPSFFAQRWYVTHIQKHTKELRCPYASYL